jgi:hypothetical protein
VAPQFFESSKNSIRSYLIGVTDIFLAGMKPFNLVLVMILDPFISDNLLKLMPRFFKFVILLNIVLLYVICQTYQNFKMYHNYTGRLQKLNKFDKFLDFLHVKITNLHKINSLSETARTLIKKWQVRIMNRKRQNANQEILAF